MQRIRFLAVTSAVAVAVGCGSDGSTAPNATPTVDVAAVVSQLTTGRVANYPALQAALGGWPASLVSIATSTSNCRYVPDTGSFLCAPFTGSGVTSNVSYWLYDASGHALSTVAGPIASIRTVVDANGTVTGTSGGADATAAVTAHSDMTMRGLLTDRRTIDGTATLHEDISVMGPTTTHSVIDLTQATASLDVPTTFNAYPKSGTLTMDFKATGDTGPFSPNPTTRTVITFNGTSKATMTIAINGVVSSTCTIDLVDGSSSCS